MHSAFIAQADATAELGLHRGTCDPNSIPVQAREGTLDAETQPLVAWPLRDIDCLFTEWR